MVENQHFRYDFFESGKLVFGSFKLFNTCISSADINYGRTSPAHAAYKFLDRPCDERNEPIPL